VRSYNDVASRSICPGVEEKPWSLERVVEMTAEYQRGKEDAKFEAAFADLWVVVQFPAAYFLNRFLTTNARPLVKSLYVSCPAYTTPPGGPIMRASRKTSR
jgi:hypothetical protein